MWARGAGDRAPDGKRGWLLPLFGVRKDCAPLAAILNKGIQSLRTASTEQLAAALGGLPAGAALRQPLPLFEDEALTLATKPV